MNTSAQAKKPAGFSGQKKVDFASLKKGSPGSMLKEFFMEELQDIYWAENHLTSALPKMQKAATTAELANAFSKHLSATQEHIRRLEQVFEMMGHRASGKKCEAMVGLVKEGEGVIEDTQDDTMTRDVALIIAAQKVEHYEIATYGGLLQLAITMGLQDVANILEKTLQEEMDTDSLLTSIAENNINWEASTEGKSKG